MSELPPLPALPVTRQFSDTSEALDEKESSRDVDSQNQLKEDMEIVDRVPIITDGE